MSYHLFIYIQERDRQSVKNYNHFRKNRRTSNKSDFLWSPQPNLGVIDTPVRSIGGGSLACSNLRWISINKILALI